MLKKFIHTVTLVLLLCSVTMANVVSNPGFESATLNPWIASSSKMGATSNSAHSGTYSANLIKNNTLYQTVPGLTPNTAYTLTAWVQGSSNSFVTMGVQNFGGNTVSVNGQASSSYHQVSLSFTTGNSASSVKIVFSHSGNDYSWLYIDDVEVIGEVDPCNHTLDIVGCPQTFPAVGGTKWLEIVSSTGWHISSSESWISLDYDVGGGNALVQVVVSQNYGDARSGIITLQSPSLSNCDRPSLTCTVNQDGVGPKVGAMEYYDGSQWAMLPPGKRGEVLTMGAASIPEWSRILGTMKDIDGNTYSTVKIGNQLWTVENFRTTKYKDGTDIPHVTDNAQWSSLTTPGYCYYENTTNTASQAKYGALYNWYAVSDPRSLAPEGWRVPTHEDWVALENYLIANGYNYDGTTTGNKIAKALASTTDWDTIGTTGFVGSDMPSNNSTGFSALPGGFRSDNETFGSTMGTFGIWWSSTEFDGSQAYNRYLHASVENLYSDYAKKKCGYSVRLVKDLD